MNGLDGEMFRTDCPLALCRWLSEPLPTTVGALEARRKHLSGHSAGELVDHVCATYTIVTRYEKSETA